MVFTYLLQGHLCTCPYAGTNSLPLEYSIAFQMSYKPIRMCNLLKSILNKSMKLCCKVEYTFFHETWISLSWDFRISQIARLGQLLIRHFGKLLQSIIVWSSNSLVALYDYLLDIIVSRLPYFFILIISYYRISNLEKKCLLTFSSAEIKLLSQTARCLYNICSCQPWQQMSYF